MFPQTRVLEIEVVAQKSQARLDYYSNYDLGLGQATSVALAYLDFLARQEVAKEW